MHYQYSVNQQAQSINLDATRLSYADKSIDLANYRFCISYFAASQLDQQLNTFTLIKEKLFGGTHTPNLNRSTAVNNFATLIPQSTGKVPVYLDLVDATKNRLLIPLDLSDKVCIDFVSEVMESHPNGYLGFGNGNETGKVLGTNQSSHVLVYVLIALAFFVGMILIGVLTN
ncbi:MAG: hypothetical protein GQ574_02570 [Crocinitomix sp.]|nr:hypothetical protein [Crocinitomix sp.]